MSSVLLQGQPVLALAVYNFENNDPSDLSGAYLIKLPYFGAESMRHVQDLWESAEAAAKVIGGNSVGLAALVGTKWLDTGDGHLLAPNVNFG